MNSKTSTEDNFKKLSYDEIIHHAQNAPKVFINLSAKEYDDVNRDPGLLLTKNEIIQIKTYEATALALPHTREDVKAYLNFGDANDAGPGLHYDKFTTLFSNTRNHALRWNPLYSEMKLTGTRLQIFSRNMGVYGESITELLNGIKTLKKMQSLLEINNIETLAQLKEIEVNSGKKFPDIELEKNTKNDLRSYLNSIFDIVKEHQVNTNELHKSITNFSNDLQLHILPNIKYHLRLVETNTVQRDVEDLQLTINERSLSIEEKTTEYKELVLKAIQAGSQFNLPGLALAIYQGVEAEKIRHARNKLCDEQAADIIKLGKKNQTLASLQKVKYDLLNLNIVTFNADYATQNLRHVWNVIHTYVKQSRDTVDKIDDALSLGLFMTEFKLVVDPWQNIATQTKSLIEVFTEADDEYKRNYIDSINQANYTMEL
ncbi:alpha-xenorhabdolysin family binary toxin subunit A [Pseudomonas sp. SIMBA_077]